MAVNTFTNLSDLSLQLNMSLVAQSEYYLIGDGWILSEQDAGQSILYTPCHYSLICSTFTCSGAWLSIIVIHYTQTLSF